MVKQNILAKYAHGYAGQLSGEGREWLMRRGLTARTVRSSLLGEVRIPLEESHGKYRGFITIPYMTKLNTVNIRFRWYQGTVGKATGTTGPKYMGMKGSQSHLYGVGETAKEKVWICEGEFDSLILSQMGFPAVGVPGASNFKSEWKYLFANCDQVTLVFDGDEAGRKGAQRLLTLLSICDNLRVVWMPEGMDVTDMYLQDEKELRRLVA